MAESKTKSLYDIFVDQVRSQEIWKRAWDLNRLKKFENYQEYKKRVSRRITKVDVPALMVTAFILIIVISLLIFFFTGPTLTHALFGLMAAFIVAQKVIETILSKRHRKEDSTPEN